MTAYLSLDVMLYKHSLDRIVTLYSPYKTLVIPVCLFLTIKFKNGYSDLTET